MNPETIRCLQICGVGAETQAQFAEILGTTRMTVREWFSPRRKQPSGRFLVVMAKLAKRVKWTPDQCTGVCK